MSMSSCRTTACPSLRDVQIAAHRDDAPHSPRRPDTGSTTSSPTATLAGCDRAGKPAEVLSGAHHQLHGKAELPFGGTRRDGVRPRCVEQRRAVVPGHDAAKAVAMLSPEHGGDRNGTASSKPKRAASSTKSLADLAKRASRPADEVHLVDREHDLAHAHQIQDGGVAAGLLLHAAAGIDEKDGNIGVRGAGRHVARVLLVAGAVDDDEAALSACRGSARRCRW